MDAICKVIEYGKKKGYSVSDLNNRIDTNKWATGLKIPEDNMKKVSAGIAQLVRDNVGKPANEKSLDKFSTEGLEGLKAKILEKIPTNGNSKTAKSSTPTISTTRHPQEKATVVDLMKLPEDRQSIEMDRIGIRLLKNDETDSHKKWPNAHSDRDNNGQYGRFLKVIQNVTKNLSEDFQTLSREEAEKKLIQAFSGLQRKIDRETRSNAAETDLRSYLSWIHFSIAKITDINSSKISETDYDSALQFMQRRGYEPHEALSVTTDADWPAMMTETSKKENDDEDFNEEEFETLSSSGEENFS